MKVLLIFKADTPIPLEPMWAALGRHCELVRVAFTDDDLDDYAAALGRLDFRGCDRVLLDQNLRRIGAQYPALRAVPNLVFLDHDACQHFLPDSRWHRKYDVVLRDIGRLRVLVPNRTCELAFRAAGVDSAYLPKCYNPEHISCLGQTRDIEFGHIGRLKNRIYAQRRRLLATVGRSVELQYLRTEDGDYPGYNRLLNRIRFFISADIGYNEYMFKNFEAMAAGCVLVAKRQPAIEQEALGFVDMENVVLYDGADELLTKVQLLRKDLPRADAIAESGRRLVESRHTMSQRGEELFELLQPEIHAAPPPSRWEKFRRLKLTWFPV